jgi:hypothetical protein
MEETKTMLFPIEGNGKENEMKKNLFRRVALVLCCGFMLAMLSIGVSASNVEGDWGSFTESGRQYRSKNRVVLVASSAGAGTQVQCTSHELPRSQVRIQTRLYLQNRNGEVFIVNGGTGGEERLNQSARLRNESYWSDSPRVVTIPTSWRGQGNSIYSHARTWAWNGNGYTLRTPNNPSRHIDLL